MTGDVGRKDICHNSRISLGCMYDEEVSRHSAILTFDTLLQSMTLPKRGGEVPIRLHLVHCAFAEHDLVLLVHLLRGLSRLARAKHVSGLHALVDEGQQLVHVQHAFLAEGGGEHVVQSRSEKVEPGYSQL